MSRNMVVIERAGDLVLVNTVRLDEEGLTALDALGRVTDVLRLAAGHGSDDPFYKERYGATVWDLHGQRYSTGMRPDRGETYFESDRALSGEEVPPVPGGRLFRFETQPPEGLLLVPHAGGTLISGDVLQHWGEPRGHFNLPGRVMMTALGFIGPYRIGKGWLDFCNPDPAWFDDLFELPFAHVLPAHGDPVLGQAKERYRPAIEAWRARYQAS